MQIQLTGHHVEIPPALRQFVTDKMERLARHFEHVTNVHVVLSVEKLQQKAEATIHLQRGTVFADAEAEDMYAAIDILIDKLDRQVKKQKEMSSDYRSGGAEIGGAEYAGRRPCSRSVGGKDSVCISVSSSRRTASVSGFPPPVFCARWCWCAACSPAA